jgi:hypothetical protein
MNLEVLQVSNPVVGKSALPDLHRTTEVLFGSKGESSLDELNRSLQGHRWCNQDVKVLRHEHIFVEQVGAASVRLQGVEE